MSLAKIIGWLFNIEDVDSIDGIEFSFVAPWAQEGGGAWVLLGGLALTAIAITFYLRNQQRGRFGFRLALGVTRALSLVGLLLILAEPAVNLRYISNPKPLLYVLFDGTDSMNIRDEMPDTQRADLARSLALGSGEGVASPGRADAKPSRSEYVQAVVERDGEQNVLDQLAKKYRLKAFRFDEPSRGVSELRLSEASSDRLDRGYLTKQLTADGDRTDLHTAFKDLATRHSSRNLAGVVVFSDFVSNSGLAVAGGKDSPVAALKAKVFTVGVGQPTAVDLAAELQAPPMMKFDEVTSATVTLRQSGLDGQRTNVRLTMRRTNTAGEGASLDEAISLASKDVELTGPAVSVALPFTPKHTGRFELRAEIAPLEGEVIDRNNVVTREVNIRDDFLRLMFVEYEPTWEWRFIKEVFHRDKLVGMRGFRTFLRSADPNVRKTNELFLPTMTPQRSEFFANDVIFLGDMPASTISPRFCELTKEFVSKFGGGLVIVAGPRFGPSQLADTPLADMLPVVVDGQSKARDQREFTLQLTPVALQYDFMRLGSETAEGENQKAWGNLGRLPWYQPVSRVHPLATVLAEHPSEKCADGKTNQPLIAIRRYGKGEVIYVGFNETWRLRKKYGEKYYRQFWGQMIHRLGLSHALGTQKRFVVRADQQEYREGDKVILTVEAYDEQYNPLKEDRLPDGKLSAEIISPVTRSGAPGTTRAITIPPLQPPDRTDTAKADASQANEQAKGNSVFEVRFPVEVGGEHRIRVRDPVTGEVTEQPIQVTSVSLERRVATRDVGVEEAIVSESKGQRFELTDVARLADIELQSKKEFTSRNLPLASTWLCFGLLVTLLLGEWLTRKLINLP